MPSAIVSDRRRLPTLFHFSDDAEIARFDPRPVRVPVQRPAGMDWLNGPLVWAIDAEHAFLYLFPRDCPRILVWATGQSSAEDRRRWLGAARIVAFVETGWVDALGAAAITRYDLDPTGFMPLDDVGMWVSHQGAEITARARIANLPDALAQADVTVRVVDTLVPLKPVWDTSLHASGIRLRHARGWSTP